MAEERATISRTPAWDDPALAEVVRRLVAAYQPERVYLYGSVARGDAGPDSDYDLLVVVPDDAPAERQRSVGLDSTLGQVADQAVPLTECAWKFRYPGETAEPDRVEADEALAAGRSVYDTIRARLPAEARP